MSRPAFYRVLAQGLDDPKPRLAGIIESRANVTRETVRQLTRCRRWWVVLCNSVDEARAIVFPNGWTNDAVTDYARQDTDPRIVLWGSGVES